MDVFVCLATYKYSEVRNVVDAANKLPNSRDFLRWSLRDQQIYPCVESLNELLEIFGYCFRAQSMRFRKNSFAC